MQLIRTAIPDVCIIEPKVFGDARGFFTESWNRRTFASLGLDFVQDNHSKSQRNVLCACIISCSISRESWSA